MIKRKGGSPAAAVFTHPGWQQSPLGVKYRGSPPTGCWVSTQDKIRRGTQRPKPPAAPAAALASGPAPTVSPRARASGALWPSAPPVRAPLPGNLCSHCCPRVSAGRRSLLEWGQTKPQSSRETLRAAKRQLPCNISRQLPNYERCS